jgi:hypothetical protein
MTFRSFALACLLSALGAGPALAATPGAAPAPAASEVTCVYPHQPGAFPDGNAATKEEMLAAKAVVSQYMADMDTYMKCLTAKEPKVDPTAQLSDDDKKELARAQEASAKKHNAAVSDEEAVAERFNVQLRAYRAKQSPPKN